MSHKTGVENLEVQYIKKKLQIPSYMPTVWYHKANVRSRFSTYTYSAVKIRQKAKVHDERDRNIDNYIMHERYAMMCIVALDVRRVRSADLLRGPDMKS